MMNPDQSDIPDNSVNEIMSNIMGNFKQTSSPPPTAIKNNLPRTRDICFDLNVDLDDFYNSKKKKINIKRKRVVEVDGKQKVIEEKKKIVQQMSPFGKLPGWTMKTFIVKAGDDLRKEVLAMQLIEFMQHVFAVEGLDIYLRPYQITCTGYQAGLVEFIEGAKSIDRIKKSASRVPATLKEYFEFNFGPSYSVFHSKAVENFVKSMAGYSLVTYLLQVAY